LTSSGAATRDFLETRVYVPSLPEQRRIAAILDQADELRIKHRRALGLLDELADSVFRDHFVPGDEFPSATVASLLADVPNAIRTGPFGSQLLKSELVAEGIPVLGIDNVVTGDFIANTGRYIDRRKFEELKRFTVHPNDVLITIMGTVGRCVVVPVDVGLAVSTKHLCCITLDQARCSSVYLKHYFQRHPAALRYLESTAKGAIMDGLNMGIIRQLPVVVPPIREQERFVASIAGIDSIRRSMRLELARLNELFAALQHRAFRGGL
jgi:type I restriction enzyme S subunit